jgi:predicted RecB family nuclease
VQKYRVDDFAAYFRLIRNRLEATSLQEHALLAAENYPEPVDHCEICRWEKVCDKKRRADDHLSLADIHVLKSLVKLAPAGGFEPPTY